MTKTGKNSVSQIRKPGKMSIIEIRNHMPNVIRPRGKIKQEEKFNLEILMR